MDVDEAPQATTASAKPELIEIENNSAAANNKPVRGNPKSGRKWKTQRLDKHSTIRKDKKVHTSWELKQKQKNDLKALKELKQSLTEARKEKNLAKKERRVEQQKRREANERKAEVVQKVKNVHKLKRMKRKLIRKIEKADTGTKGVAGPGFDD